MIDKILDQIYDRIDTLAINGEFDKINRILWGVNISKLTVDGLLGYLTATLPCKTKLENRHEFFLKVEEEIKKRGEYEPELLKGLEQDE